MTIILLYFWWYSPSLGLMVNIFIDVICNKRELTWVPTWFMRLLGFPPGIHEIQFNSPVVALSWFYYFNLMSELCGLTIFGWKINCVAIGQEFLIHLTVEDVLMRYLRQSCEIKTENEGLDLDFHYDSSSVFLLFASVMDNITFSFVIYHHDLVTKLNLNSFRIWKK